MKKINKYFLILCLFLVLPILGFSELSSFDNTVLSIFCPDTFNQLPITDWNNPSLEDFACIETYLRERKQEVIKTSKQQHILSREKYGQISYRIGRLQLFNNEAPKLETIYFNNNPNYRKRCIICYAGYDNTGRNYLKGISTILRALNTLNYKGHFIYRLGGWPNIQKGRLKYADVPYAFKPFLFEEVADMGYEKILWLDSACLPINNLDVFFATMNTFGCCFLYEDAIPNSTVHDWDFIRRCVNAQRNKKYLNVITQIVGINTQHKKGKKILSQWIDAACLKLSFLNPSADQLCFAFLIGKNNLENGAISPSFIYRTYNWTLSEIPKHCCILHDYKILEPSFQLPANFDPWLKARN